jgi:hypothetical protein
MIAKAVVQVDETTPLVCWCHEKTSFDIHPACVMDMYKVR